MRKSALRKQRQRQSVSPPNQLAHSMSRPQRERHLQLVRHLVAQRRANVLSSRMTFGTPKRPVKKKPEGTIYIPGELLTSTS
ncbi:hypothetical protein [Ralstonia mojiangensis]|uniref:hypothetical protein n=1 Tax=Ralstonia mojiangensis TaxID=2953895 RepID=UPI00209158F2|nr:hypothetical protein [Ralstonia mojiangensis]MCO5413438.1 hypothetical protein [Ralstonia mojiangensis]